jgi:pimeloyl-ACP methyl ester carboxylesterase
METVRSADGTEIAYEREGAGPPRVLVGGAFSERTGGAGLAAALPGFEVLRYDRRGRGDSGDTPPYAVEREVEDLVAVLGAAGGAAAVYGHSSGAALALAAATAGAPINRLAVYEPPFNLEGGDAELRGQIEALLASGDRAGAIKRFLVEAVELPEEAVASAEHWPDWDGMLRVAPTLAYDLAVVGDGRIPAAVGGLTMPVLVLHGGDSVAWMRASNEALVAAIPGARGVELAGQGHNAEPALVAAELVPFLQ